MSSADTTLAKKRRSRFGSSMVTAASARLSRTAFTACRPAVGYQHDGAAANAPIVTAVHPTIDSCGTHRDIRHICRHEPWTANRHLRGVAQLRPAELVRHESDLRFNQHSQRAASRAQCRLRSRPALSGPRAMRRLDRPCTRRVLDDTVTHSATFTATVAATQPPTIIVTAFPATTVTSSPITQLRVDWCAPEDALTQHTLTWQGQTLASTYTTVTRAGCFDAGTSIYNNLAINPWQQALVATATTAFPATRRRRPRRSPTRRRSTQLRAARRRHRRASTNFHASGATAAADTFTVTNTGHRTPPRTRSPQGCGGLGTLSGCSPAARSSRCRSRPEPRRRSSCSSRAPVRSTCWTRSACYATYTSPLGAVDRRHGAQGGDRPVARGGADRHAPRRRTSTSSGNSSRQP